MKNRFKVDRLKLTGSKMLLVIFLLSGFIYASAQSVVATLKADSTQIVIGDHLNVRLAVKFPRHLKVGMPVLKDSMGSMDVLSASKIDTINQPTEIVLTQNFTISAFDSGIFHAGPVKVIYTNSTGQVDTILSNDVPITVNTVPVDTTKPFKPIKAPLEIPYSWKEFIPYIIGAVVLLALIVIGIVLWLNYKKQKPQTVARPVPKDPAHIWARKELKKLEDEKLWQKDQVKLYYSRLTDILRLYLEFRFNWLALESTTEEIEEDMEKYNIKEKAKDSLLSILRSADLVKFAKMLPAPETNIAAMESAKKFIDFTEPKDKEEGKNKKQN